MNAEFHALAHQVTHRLWKHKPVAATYQGIHFYDDRFVLFNGEYLNAFADEADDLARQLRRFRDPDLAPDERVERDLLRGALEIAAAEVREMEYHTRSADIYIADIIQGLWVLVLRDNAPAAERGRMVLERLRGVWRVLREGTANLRSGRNVPKVWTEHGIQATEGALRFIETELEDFIEHLDDATLQADLREAVPPARKAIRHYLDFLRLDMLASSKGRYGVGKDHYLLLLSRRHGIDLGLAELRAWADERVAAARAALERYATEQGDGRTWQELIREVRRDVPASDDLPDVYRQAFERARAFVAERGLVSVPEGARTFYAWNPQHFRQFHPLVGVIPAAPFEPLPVSFVYVTQMESTRQDEDRVNLVAPHCTASLAERAATHAYPGHLLRALHTSRIAGRLTRAHGAFPLVFGWASYAREMMREAGFFSGRHELLFYHRAEFIDAVRALMDLRMHTEDLTLDEATNAFEELLDCEMVVAEREARRFTITPCEGVSYLWGRERILELREELRARGGFDLRRFHDTLLGCGTLPFSVVRERMLAGEARPAAEQAQEPMSALAPPAPKPVDPEARPAPRPARLLSSQIASFSTADRDHDDEEDETPAPSRAAARPERDTSNGHHPPAAEKPAAPVAAAPAPPAAAKGAGPAAGVPKAAATGAKGSVAAPPAAPAAAKPASPAPAASAKSAPQSEEKSTAKSSVKATGSGGTAAKPSAKAASANPAARANSKSKARPAAKTAPKAPAAPAKGSKPAAKSASKPAPAASKSKPKSAAGKPKAASKPAKAAKPAKPAAKATKKPVKKGATARSGGTAAARPASGKKAAPAKAGARKPAPAASGKSATRSKSGAASARAKSKSSSKGSATPRRRG